MRILYIGGTGEISASCVSESVKLGFDVTVFNRGNRSESLPDSVGVIKGDMNDDAVYKKIAQQQFDAVCQFFIFEPAQAKRDIEFFSGNTGQYVFISTASAYHKPLDRYSVITEKTPLQNAYWEYSRKKIAMEELLFEAHNKGRIPVTVIRPSHTYRKRFPTPVFDGDWTAQRMLEGKSILVPGDGTSLWTLTHADDFAKPFARLLCNEKAVGEAFHITRDQPYTWLEILSAMANALEVNFDYVTVAAMTILKYAPETTGELLGDKIQSTIFNNDKVKRIAGDFSCDVSLEQGMVGVARAFRERADSLPARPELDMVCTRIIADQRALANE
ncbi:MAG: NAD-dependent epimerase/dehydratase family protein [Gammaproteobacteria bacterium]|nr:NAD-dependent epimerase/dehydratase family protein [Gammaproteobacteria bacterium]